MRNHLVFREGDAGCHATDTGGTSLTKWGTPSQVHTTGQKCLASSLREGQFVGHARVARLLGAPMV